MAQIVSDSSWIKSSHSGGDGGQCVEWAPGFVQLADVVPVRDSKVPAGPVLMVSPEAFAGLAALARGTAP
ncbi:DUF397 domain-containing protein [Streptomyces uncialis]|uniref:DUF397 domain-containing protein n=1 Tax=Streptomyces uncialis TaxID=1048205 RepID=A0A1Q4VCT7_9ACTN|nr:DUF397 domain-containing protein [Streptomyces uncialis]OKH95579.1 hypothetical protein AB852_01830 [Streptomyces uncialis]